MRTLVRTHTRTFVELTPWAETLPWDCRSPGHSHSPMVGDLCAVGDCDERLVAGEVCYAVTEIGRDERNRERWACWRHVRPDEGPIRVNPPEKGEMQ